MKIVPLIYIFYCSTCIICSFFDVEGFSVSFVKIKYWLLNLTIIYTLSQRSRFNWFILFLILLSTTYIIINYHDNSSYEYISFTMSPVFNLRNLILPNYYYRYTGLTLQLLLTYWLFRKDTRDVYNIS
jgi:hypothetical protein